MNKNYRSGRHVVYSLHAHVLLTPKYRRKVFSPQVHNVIYHYIQKVCDDHDVILEEFNTDLDHAHLVISYPPKVCLSTFIGQLKGYSSKMIREEHYDLIKHMLYGNSFWSPSYFISSTGGVPLEYIKKYVQDQGREPKTRGNPNFSR